MIKPVSKIMKHYKQLEKNEDYQWVKWAKNRRRFSVNAANIFFIGIMLDQGQRAERAWDGAEHLVQNQFQGNPSFWESISQTHHLTLKKICQKGYDETSYSSVFTFNRFPGWLRQASRKILNEYDGDPRNIWNVSSANVDVIYDRFIEFDGIGDALSKMAQFILVRNYGVAGGEKSKSNMSFKPDVLVRRVLYRSGICPSERISTAIETIEALHLPSQADFDAAAWVIGREYCKKSGPDCRACPLTKDCNLINRV